jgi:twitching motility protein PilT
MDITSLLALGIERRASDVHLLPGLSPVLRIDGDLIALDQYPTLTAESTKALLYSMLSQLERDEFETKLELDLAISLPQLGNFRLSLLHQLRGVAGVLRIIPEHIPSFESLDLPSSLKSLLLLPHGLVLVTGPTGSGKSTTLAAMIDYINKIRACHIITIEDPIEFIYHNKKSLINQRQVYRDTHNAAAALRASLRQDPDVILLGELRDLETIRLALTAAETGHLVMATLHASTAPTAISRIVDAFPAEEKERIRHLLAETLQAILCQTLVKKMNGGRIAAFEIMLATPAIQNQIRQDKVAHMVTTIQTNGDKGMCTMDQYLQDLVMKNIISVATARAVSVHQDRFKEL